MRTAGGMFFGRDQWWEYSAFFLSANTNKYDVTLTLDTPKGRELALELVKKADIVIENFTPRVIEAFDLDWPVVHEANPNAILVRMPAFGLDGPWRDRPGFAQTMEQITGLAWVTSHADDQPRIQRGPCDPNGGLHAVFAALVALERRERTGEGCLVEAPMFEAAINVGAEPAIEWSANGVLGSSAWATTARARHRRTCMPPTSPSAGSLSVRHRRAVAGPRRGHRASRARRRARAGHAGRPPGRGRPSRCADRRRGRPSARSRRPWTSCSPPGCRPLAAPTPAGPRTTSR